MTSSGPTTGNLPKASGPGTHGPFFIKVTMTYYYLDGQAIAEHRLVPTGEVACVTLCAQDAMNSIVKS